MGKIGDLFVRLGLKSDDFKKGIDDANEEVQGFSSKLEKMKAGALAVWGAIGAAVTKVAMDMISATNLMNDAWEKSMSSIRASYHSILAEITDKTSEKKGWFWSLFNLSDPSAAQKLGANAKAAGDAAAEMTAAFDAEFELAQSVRLQRQQVQQELNELFIAMRDTTLSAADRKAAAEKYKQLLEPIAQAEVKVYGNMLKYAIKAWAAGTDLDREYSEAEMTEFFSKVGTAYEEMERKFPDLMRVYEKRKGDAQNLIIFDTLGKLQTAATQMSDIDRILSRTTLSINKQLAGVTTNARVEIPEMPELPNIQGLAQMQNPMGINADEFYKGLMDSNAEYLDWYKGMVDTMQHLNYVLEDSIVSATTNGLQAFADMLMGIEDATPEQVLAAFLAPFGDTLKQMGAMIMAEGIAMDAFKKSFSNPYAAIAAGAALIAVGSVVSAGLQKLTANPAGGSSSSYGGGSYGSAGQAAENYESTLTINVVGTIKGSDIALSLDRTNKNNKR